MMSRPYRGAGRALPLVVLMAACGGAQIPPGARTTVVSIDKLDCAGCGEELASNLAKTEGVYQATFDKRRSEVTVVAAPSFDVFTTAKRLAAKEEYELVLGAGKGTYLDWEKVPEGADVVTVARDGQDVPDLEAVAVKGKVTIVDFSAVWCEPCRELDKHVLTVVEARKDVAYRKLDVGDWDTPLAQHYLKGIPSLPYVIVYDRSGKRIEAFAGLDLPKLDAAIARGSR